MSASADRLTRQADDAAFDDLTELAAHVCDAPMSMLSFVDAERQCFNSRHGVELSETSREQSFCAHAITASGELEVPDTWLDRDSPPTPW